MLSPPSVFNALGFYCPNLMRHQSLPGAWSPHLWHHYRQITQPFSTNEYLPSSYLPGLVQTMHQLNCNTPIAARHLAYSSDDTEESGSFGGMRIEDLEYTYNIVLNVLRHATDGNYMLDCLYDMLKRSFRNEDGRFGRGRQSQQPRAIHLFRAFAEVSRQAQSLELGDVLSAFMFQHGQTLSRDELRNDLALWSHAVYRASMADNDKRYCLRMIIHRRPDVIDALRNSSSSHAYALARFLQQLENNFGPGPFHMQGRGRDLRRLHGRKSFSLTRSPDRSLARFHNAANDMLSRPRSAVGQQANLVIIAAEDMRDEAVRLRDLAG